MDNKEIILEEYKATQESISHYETMIWNIGSIFTVIIVGILSLTIKLDQPDSLIIPIIVAIWFYGLWILFEVRYRQINLSKFRRLWDIENQLGMMQNLYVKEDDLKRKFIPRGHLLILFAGSGFPITLIVIYILFKLR
jgi:hypothetical protein